VKGRPTETEDFIQIHVPLAQDTQGDTFLLVRPVSGRAEALVSPVRAAIARVDKQQIVGVRNVMTLDDVESTATKRHRFRAVLVMALAGPALLLGTVGLFGTLSYSVQQRVRDFGVRRALGATTSDVVWLVAGVAGRLIAAGALIGLAVSAALGQLLVTILFGGLDCRPRMARHANRSRRRAATGVKDGVPGRPATIRAARRLPRSIPP
jgi:putative ABC transport system permease protein